MLSMVAGQNRLPCSVDIPSGDALKIEALVATNAHQQQAYYLRMVGTEQQLFVVFNC